MYFCFLTYLVPVLALAAPRPPCIAAYVHLSAFSDILIETASLSSQRVTRRDLRALHQRRPCLYSCSGIDSTRRKATRAYRPSLRTHCRLRDDLALSTFSPDAQHARSLVPDLARWVHAVHMYVVRDARWSRKASRRTDVDAPARLSKSRYRVPTCAISRHVRPGLRPMRGPAQRVLIRVYAENTA